MRKIYTAACYYSIYAQKHLQNINPLCKHSTVGMIVRSCMFTLDRHVCVLGNNHND